MLEVEQLSYSYGTQPALVEVSLRVEGSEVVTVLGANGAGKTTLLRTISGLQQPSQGTVRFLDQRIDGLPPHRICSMGLVHVPEGRQLFPEMTVLENLQLGAYLPQARKHMRTSLEQVMSLFPRLKARLGQMAGTLSGGEQQMLAIGRALMARPKLLMLDEPTLGLAPLAAHEIFEALARLVREQNVTLLLVSQEVVQALQISTRAYILETGRVVGEGSASEMLTNPKVREAYLGI
jgi:branched-chain amino acid transport system ATP-binding protein